MTSPPSAAFDVLSDLWGRVRPSGAILFRGEFREPWSVQKQGGGQYAGRLAGPGQRVIPFHVVGCGGCWVDLAANEPVWVGEGEAVLFPGGDSHCLRAREAGTPEPMIRLLPPPPRPLIPVVRHGGQGAATRIVCGFLRLDDWMFQPMAVPLPPVLRARQGAPDGECWLPELVRHIARHIAREAHDPGPGTGAMLPRLVELMFVERLRRHMRELPADGLGPFAACNDSVVGAALKLLHASPLENWDLARLSREVGASRSVLGARFKALLGHPPMQYLVRWRLRLAAQQFLASDVPVKSVVDAMGYATEAAFSRAFKRVFGQPPGEWRQSRRAP